MCLAARVSSPDPPLTVRDQAWRLGLVLAMSVVVWLPVVRLRTPVELVGEVALGVVALVLVCYRRRRPYVVAVVTLVLAAVSSLAVGPSILAVVSVSTRRRWGPLAGIWVLCMVTNIVYAALSPADSTTPAWLLLALDAVSSSAMIGWGMYIGSRRELLAGLRRRAEVAEAERDLRARQSRLEERARIAREMHDVLAHRITQISVHAGALSYRPDLGAEQVGETATVIREAAHDALVDLRGILGVLRDSSGSVVEAPQPTYADVPGLVADAVAAGASITLSDRLGTGPAVPEATGRAVFRIVQEGITNAGKHARGADLLVVLSGSPADGVRVVLRNEAGRALAAPSSGFGLAGLAERAELGGGRLTHREEDGEFVLESWLPWVTPA
jgi:signal transduction histidine kinase